MGKGVLILANSNAFTVLTNRTLSKSFKPHLLNVRYENEAMSKDDHFFQQLQDVYYAWLYKEGYLPSPYLFTFNERLHERIEETMYRVEPSVIFYEMKTLDEAEWTLLKSIKSTYDTPIVACIEEGMIGQNIHRLLKYGVREVVSNLEEQKLISVASRNINSPF